MAKYIETSSDNLTQKIIRHIYRMITQGQLVNGDRLPTNRELADELGVSILTVQKALKNLEATGVVSCQRRRGTFLVDSSQISSPRISSGLVGLFCPELLTDFHSEALLELEQHLSGAGKLLNINFTHSRPEKEIELLRHVLRQRLEALVYFTSPLVAGSLSVSKTVGAWVDRYIREGTDIIFLDLSPIGYQDRLISLDNEAAGYQLGRVLIDQGHRHIAFVGASHLTSGAGRCAGYQRAMVEAGLQPNDDHVIQVRIIEGSETELAIPQRVEELIHLYPEITGFVVDNTSSAITVRTVLQRMPDRSFSPEESIAGCFEELTPPFDAVAWIHIPGREMGRLAAERIINSPEGAFGPRLIEPTLWSKEPLAELTS